MRTTHALVVAAVVTAFLALGVKAIFFSAPTAEADSATGSTPSVFELHRNIKDLPVQDTDNPI